MTEERYQELKETLRIEEDRRNFIREEEKKLESLRNGLGLVKENGWMRGLTTTIEQRWVQNHSNDGNSGYDTNEKVKLNLTPREVEILLVAFEYLASLLSPYLEKLKKEEISIQEYRERIALFKK